MALQQTQIVSSPSLKSRPSLPARWALWLAVLVAALLFRRLVVRSSAQTQTGAVPINLSSRSVEKCDVLVVGATPSGIAAALAAARRNAKVVLVEERAHMGGDIVYAMLNQFDVPMKPGTASPSVHGIFAEFFDQLGIAFSIDRGRRLFEETVAAEPNIRVCMKTHVGQIYKENDAVTGVVLRGGPGSPIYSYPNHDLPLAFHALVDATNDANIAARAGSGYSLGREGMKPDKRMQSAGLLFEVKNVQWRAVREYVGRIRSEMQVIKPRRKPLPVANGTGWPTPTPTPQAGPLRKHLVYLREGGITGNYAWERGDIVRAYKPHGPNVMLLSLNLGRQSNGTVVLNTLNIVGVNGLSDFSIKQAIAEGRQEMPYLMPYLRRKMPGFAHAQLVQIAPELYIRETRHIHGFYTLQVSDVRSRQRFFDRVALVSYPLDLHPYKKGEYNVYGPRRYNYTLPLRSLVPKKVDGIFVASRSLSSSYTAAGSARVIPVTMEAGEAAGAAAWLCATRNTTPHGLVKDAHLVRELQDSLREWSADIGDVVPSNLVLVPKPVHKAKPV